ncbi:MAG: TonB-dependent receptor, partial [Gemmatimonadota bacterium]
MTSWRLRAMSSVAFACASATSIAAAQTHNGRITTRITDRESGRAVEGAQVLVVGSTIGAMSSANGIATIARITPGTYQLRIVRLGYESAVVTTSVRAGDTTHMDVVLARAAYQLESVVSTATGRSLTRELGHSIAQLDVSDIVQRQPITSFQDLLNGRAAGVAMLASNGTVGGGARVRIRGLNSLALVNDPLLIVDGVRVEQSSPTLGGTVYIGGGRPNFMNNLNPDEIENIEIAKGPAAATLYGTQAANGVILVTTKRGRAGSPAWHTYAERGRSSDPASYPSIYYSAGWLRNGSRTNCLQWMAKFNACSVEQTYKRNLLEDPETSPIGTGERQQYGAQVLGGSDGVRYFLGADWEDELGVLRMPNAERDSLYVERGVDDLPRRQEIPNQLRKTSLRSNLGLTLSHMAELNVSAGFGHGYNLLPQTGDNIQSVLASAMTGIPNPALRNVWGFAPPRDVFSKSVARTSNQLTNGATLLYRPKDWLDTRTTLGMDWLQYDDQADVAPGQGCKFCGREREGLRTINRWSNMKFTFDAGATAAFSLTPTLTSTTALGVQWNRDGRHGTLNTAFVLAPGGRTLDFGSEKSSGEQSLEGVSLGAYIEQRFAWRNLLYVTAALRRDENSAFGSSLGAITYPKVAVSYVMREGDRAGWLNHLRVRAAFGASGQAPTPSAALTQLVPTTSSVFSIGDVPSVTFGALGNDHIKPERTREVEGGVDVTALRNRLSLSVTYYDKRTSDALVSRALPGSLGAGSARMENVGVVSN